MRRVLLLRPTGGPVAGADLLVTHHPLLLRGVHGVSSETSKGAAVTVPKSGNGDAWR